MMKHFSNRNRFAGAALCVLMTGGLCGVLVEVRATWLRLTSDFRSHASLPTVPSTSSIRSARTVAIASADGARLTAWWLPGPRHHPIVLLHGSGAARDQLIPEAEVLSEFGYSVLLLDLPGHGGSSGEIVWGRSERLAVGAAVSFVSDQAPGASVGLLGFSLGAMIAAQVASTDSRVRAVVLAGIPASFDAQMKREHSNWGWLSSYPAIWSARIAGYRDDGPEPIKAVTKVGALLVIVGTSDTTVPCGDSLGVFGAAHHPKELLRVEGGHHGDYAQVLGRESYGRAITRFFERHLENGNRGL